MVAWGIPHPSTQLWLQLSHFLQATRQGWAKTCFYSSFPLGQHSRAQYKNPKQGSANSLSWEESPFQLSEHQGLPDPKDLRRRWTVGFYSSLPLRFGDSKSRDALPSRTETGGMHSQLHVQWVTRQDGCTCQHFQEHSHIRWPNEQIQKWLFVKRACKPESRINKKIRINC